MCAPSFMFRRTSRTLFSHCMVSHFVLSEWTLEFHTLFILNSFLCFASFSLTVCLFWSLSFICFFLFCQRQVSPCSFGADDRDVGVWYSVRPKHLCLVHSIHTGSGYHSASNPRSTGRFCPGNKAIGASKCLLIVQLVARLRMCGL